MTRAEFATLVREYGRAEWAGTASDQEAAHAALLAAYDRLAEDAARWDRLERLLWTPASEGDERGSIGDVAFFGTWGGCTVRIGDPDAGGVESSATSAREAFDAAAGETAGAV